MVGDVGVVLYYWATRQWASEPQWYSTAKGEDSAHVYRIKIGFQC